MAQTASIAAKQFATFLSDSENGIAPAVSKLAADSGIALAAIPPGQIISQNVPAAIAERAAAVKYPVVHVYSNRVRNSLTEKFRKFSGKIQTVAEVRVSQDRMEGLEDQTRLYVDAVTQVLDSNRGSWGQGMFYAGGYEVAFEPVQQGGKNLMQVARVTFEVDLSS
ncbi:MAG TPA: hypothetical protein VKX39_15150 [Bryobacteraceae bacterium]|jgi:hypothetical protein|nr:hypothetical protein [Bryobacteraceae bacterium]